MGAGTPYLAVVLTQAVHAVEEYAAGFTERFPPARWLGRRVPGLPRTGFIALNVALVAFGLAGYWWIGQARALLWFWTALALYNTAAHLMWAALARRYNPGLVTAVLFLPPVVYPLSRLL